jgi:hypothetical protein
MYFSKITLKMSSISWVVEKVSILLSSRFTAFTKSPGFFSSKCSQRMLMYFLTLTLISNSDGYSKPIENVSLIDLIRSFQFFLARYVRSLYSNLAYSEAKYLALIPFENKIFSNSRFSCSSHEFYPFWLRFFKILSIFSNKCFLNPLTSFFQVVL